MVGSYVLHLLVAAGEFKTLTPHFDGSCVRVSDLAGPEDMVLLPGGAGAFFSSEDRRAMLEGAPVDGGIYFYDLRSDDTQLVNRTPNPPPGFHPHGLGLYAPDGEQASLMVVSHPRADLHGDVPGNGPAHTVEIFDVGDDAQLTHRRTFSDPLLITPNDVAPVGPDAFYATNDHGTGDPSGRMVEDYLRLGRAHIVFCDASGCRRLPGTYEYANGIQISADGTEVYLAAPTMRTIFVFDRDVATNDLTLRAEVFVGTGPDNINIDAQGNLWVGAHPKLLTLTNHLADGEGTSPSQVLRLAPDGQGGFTVDEVLLSDGSDLGASTAAVRLGDRLLVGGVFGPGFLDCRMTSP